MARLRRLIRTLTRAHLVLVTPEGRRLRVRSVGIYAAERGVGYFTRDERWCRYDGAYPLEITWVGPGTASLKLTDAVDGSTLWGEASRALVFPGGVRLEGPMPHTLAWEPQHWETLQIS